MFRLELRLLFDCQLFKSKLIPHPHSADNGRRAVPHDRRRRVRRARRARRRRGVRAAVDRHGQGDHRTGGEGQVRAQPTAQEGPGGQAQVRIGWTRSKIWIFTVT